MIKFERDLRINFVEKKNPPSFLHLSITTAYNLCLFKIDPIYWILEIIIIFYFMSCSRIFHLYEDVTIAGEGKFLDLCLTLSLSREGPSSCHIYCDTGPRFFRSHPKDRPIQSPHTTYKGMWRIYSNTDRHGSIL
jgi:hypothetical protein